MYYPKSKDKELSNELFKNPIQVCLTEACRRIKNRGYACGILRKSRPGARQGICI